MLWKRFSFTILFKLKNSNLRNLCPLCRKPLSINSINTNIHTDTNIHTNTNTNTNIKSDYVYAYEELLNSI